MASFIELMGEWQGEEENQVSLNRLLKGSVACAGAWQVKRPGFFTPYKSFCDAAYDVVFPFVGPIVLGAIAVVTGVIAAMSTIAFVGCFLFSEGVSYFDEAFATEVMDLAVLGAVVALVTGVASLLFAISAIVSGPLTAIQFVSRTGATIANQLGCYPEPEIVGALRSEEDLFAIRSR